MVVFFQLSQGELVDVVAGDYLHVGKVVAEFKADGVDDEAAILRKLG